MKKNKFTPEEWNGINAALNAAIAVAWPELGIEPYPSSTAEEEEAKEAEQCQKTNS